MSTSSISFRTPSSTRYTSARKAKCTPLQHRPIFPWTCALELELFHNGPPAPAGRRFVTPKIIRGLYVLVTVLLALAYVAIVALLYLALPGVVLKFSMAACRMSDESQTINSKATSDRSPRSRHQNDLPVRVPLEYFLVRRSHIGQREGLIDDDFKLTFLHKGHQL